MQNATRKIISLIHEKNLKTSQCCKFSQWPRLLGWGKLLYFLCNIHFGILYGSYSLFFPSILQINKHFANHSKHVMTLEKLQMIAIAPLESVFKIKWLSWWNSSDMSHESLNECVCESHWEISKKMNLKNDWSKRSSGPIFSLVLKCLRAFISKFECFMIYSMVMMHICHFAVERWCYETILGYGKRNEGQDSLEYTCT